MQTFHILDLSEIKNFKCKQKKTSEQTARKRRLILVFSVCKYQIRYVYIANKVRKTGTALYYSDIRLPPRLQQHVANIQGLSYEICLAAWESRL